MTSSANRRGPPAWTRLASAALLVGTCAGNEETAVETCARLAAEQGTGESMAGMNCYQTQAEAIHVALNMCCNGTCCSGAHQMGASCPWAPGHTHESCSSARLLALSRDNSSGYEGEGSQESVHGVSCTKLYGMYDKKAEAEAAAEAMGCGGDVHMMGDMWMPGTSMDTGCGECSGDLAGHTMAMAFSAKDRVGEILFKSWTGDSHSKYWGSVVAVFILGWLYEGLKHVLRPAAVKLARSWGSERGEDGKLYDSTTGLKKPLRRRSLAHAVDAVMYGLQLTLGYWLMLVAMVYNVGLFVSVVLGAATGYFCFALPNEGLRHIDDDNGCCD